MTLRGTLVRNGRPRTTQRRRSRPSRPASGEGGWVGGARLVSLASVYRSVRSAFRQSSDTSPRAAPRPAPSRRESLISKMQNSGLGMNWPGRAEGGCIVQGLGATRRDSARLDALFSFRESRRLWVGQLRRGATQPPPTPATPISQRCGGARRRLPPMQRLPGPAPPLSRIAPRRTPLTASPFIIVIILSARRHGRQWPRGPRSPALYRG